MMKNVDILYEELDEVEKTLEEAANETLDDVDNILEAEESLSEDEVMHDEDIFYEEPLEWAEKSLDEAANGTLDEAVNEAFDEAYEKLEKLAVGSFRIVHSIFDTLAGYFLDDLQF